MGEDEHDTWEATYGLTRFKRLCLTLLNAGAGFNY